jgi:two-component system phosphate regulon sensor histidine kinase PhoR
VTLTRRLLASYLAIVVVTAAVLTAAADLALRRRLVQEAAAELEREAHYLAAVATGRTVLQLDTLVRALSAATGRRLTVVDRSGDLLADSDFPRRDLGTLENHALRPEFREALAGRTGTDQRRSTSTGRDELKVAVPWAGGAVRVSSTMPQVDRIVRRAQGAVFMGALLASLVALALAARFAGGVARPLVALRDAAQAIARGERPVLDVRGRDEVGDLARALRTLDEDLAARVGDLERERGGTAALIGAMVEGVIACDSRGVVRTMNPAARELFGVAAGDTPPAALELFRQRTGRDAVAAVLAGETMNALEVELASRTALLSGKPLETGGAVFVVHDVTALKRLETMRRDFVANVSHELKTPLTVVRGYTETLLKDDPPAEVRATFLAAMLSNAQRMQRLIDDLLDLSRIESGGWHPMPGPVALEPLIGEVRETLGAGGADPMQLNVELAPDAREVWADTDAVRQILSNILDNARRHSPAGAAVTLRSARLGSGVRIEIGDTGQGIASEHLPRIFERFYRVDPDRSRALGGTGLGLAIVRHLVEAHGGRVEAESVLGKGTTVRVFLPAH